MNYFLLLIVISVCLCDIDVSGLDAINTEGLIKIKGWIKITKPKNRYTNSTIKLGCTVTDHHATESDFETPNMYTITQKQWEKEKVHYTAETYSSGDIYACALIEINSRNKVSYFHGINEVIIETVVNGQYLPVVSYQPPIKDSTMCKLAKIYNSKTRFEVYCGDKCDCHIITASFVVIGKAIHCIVYFNRVVRYIICVLIMAIFMKKAVAVILRHIR